MTNDSLLNQDSQPAPEASLQTYSIPDCQTSLHEAEAALHAAAQLIHRSYLCSLKDFPVQPLEASAVLDTAQSVRIFRMERLVVENRLAILESLTAIYTALGTAGHTVFLLIDSDGSQTHLYIGARASVRGNGQAAGNLIKESFDGHFPGSQMRALNDAETKKLLDLCSVTERSDRAAVTAVTGVPTLSVEEREHFTQGLERFLDAAESRAYTAMILAQPISSRQLHEIRTGFESAATQITPLQKSQLSYGVQDSEAVGLSLTSGISTALGQSLSLTETTGTTDTTSASYSTSKSRTKDPSALIGALAPVAIGGAFIVGAPVAATAVGAAALMGSSAAIAGVGGAAAMTGALASGLSSSILGSTTTSTAATESTSHAVANSESRAISESTTVTDNYSATQSDTRTLGSSRQLTLELSNKSIEQLLKKIDHHLVRLDEARAYGAWQSAAYFISSTTETSQSLGSLFLGLMRGNKSGAEDFALTTWNYQQHEKRDQVLQWLAALAHPRLEPDFGSVLGGAQVTPAALLSGRELALQLGLPRRSVSAAAVLEVPAYGRNVRLLDLDAVHTDSHTQRLRLGALRHLWRDSETGLHLELDKLCYHTLITGTTGVGKTTAIMSLLAQTHQKGVPFLVIEPAKGEYRRLLGLSRPGRPVIWRVAGRVGSDALRINPMIFPSGIELTDHIDRLCTVFNAAFPMYAAMPQILEEAVFESYEELGWDTITSQCVGVRRFPTLRRVTELIPGVVERLGYSVDASSDYVGALSARLRSLCRGSLGMTLLCAAEEETSDQELFEGSAVVDLSPMGSPEKRALLMGILFMRLYEKRIVQGVPEGTALRHLMVLEEAHVLLKRTAVGQSQESSNPRGLAVEAFANALAEMRAYGQGFIVADQSASVLDDCVLRNTNTKIVMRAPFEEDRKVLGGALALDERQTQQLARLENRTAVIHQSNWLEPVLCRIEKIDIPAIRAPAEGEKNKLIQRQARTVLLLGLWGDRHPDGLRPALTFEELDKFLVQAGLPFSDVACVREACISRAPRALTSLAELFPRVLPWLHDSTFIAVTLSLRAQWNSLNALLSRELDLPDRRTLHALAIDCLKVLNLQASQEELKKAIEQFKEPLPCR